MTVASKKLTNAFCPVILILIAYINVLELKYLVWKVSYRIYYREFILTSFQNKIKAVPVIWIVPMVAMAARIQSASAR